LAQVLFTIANRVLPEAELREFQACDLETQQYWLTATLRSTRYVLILDNLESVTAAALSIPNALPETDREVIAAWLRSLLGGKTLVVLGSRGREEWLSRVYGKNHLSLQGLDPAARLILAEQILDVKVKDADKIAAIQNDQDFKKLMQLLAGYPLAMEVVLGNLARLSPGEVLAGLDAADVDLDRPDARDKTESILQCIDFSFCGLSEAARNLLVCLAPFSGFIFVGGLEKYAEQLESIAELTPFVGAHGNAPSDNVGAESGGRTAVTPLRERLAGAVQEAIDWGLLSPISPENPGLLSIQPTLPFFLRSKLAGWDEAARSGLRQAFKQHYLGLAGLYQNWLDSKQANERKLGIFFVRQEYENLSAALQLCLESYDTVKIYFCLFDYLRLNQNFALALEQAETVYQALQHYPTSQKETFGFDISMTLNRLAACALELKDYERARSAYLESIELDKALTGISEQQRNSSIASTYHQLGRVAQELREFEEARRNYQQALQIFIEFNDRYSQASTYGQLGIAAQELREFEEARRNYQQALQIFIEFNDRYSQASTYHNLGYVAQELREFEEARRNYQQALQIFIEFNDRYSQASTYHQLGRVAEELREFEEARRNYQQALQIFIEFNDRHSQASTYHNLGYVAQELREFEEARRNYQQALQIKIEFNDRHSQANTYHQLGNVAYLLREFEEARRNYQLALQIFIEFNDRYSQARVYGQLGMLEETQENYPEATQNLLRALEIFAQFNDEHSVMQVLQILARIYTQTQDETLLIAIANFLGTTPDDLRQIFTPQ
jgi:tetratricopeptide (TPR) repeat protein